MQRKRWLLVGGGALLLLASLALWLLLPSNPESTTPSRQAAPQVNSSLVELQWHVGAAQQYRVQTDSSMQMNTNGTAKTLPVRMNCGLELRTLEANSGTALVGMQLSTVDLQIGGQTDPGTNQALSVPFRVRFASGGYPEAFEFPAGVTAQNREILENLVRMFQVTMNKGESWTAQESNGSGAYEAAYRRTGPTQVEKTKQHFKASASSPPMLEGADITSTESFSLDPGRDWIAAMILDEKLQSKGQGGPAVTITNHATLKLQSASQTAASADKWQFTASAAPPDTRSIQHPIPNISKEEARARILDAVSQLDAAKQGRMTWVHELRDLLRVDDAMPAVLLEVLRTQQLSDRTRADLYLAFEQAGTKAAQTAMSSVITDTSWATKDALRAIVALGGVDHPSSDTLSTLWSTALDTAASGERQGRIASTATFALGSLGSAMKAAKDPDYSSLRTSLLDSAMSGVNTEQRANFVFALGNTHDATLSDDITPLLSDSAPAIRRAAALSLGMIGATDRSAGVLMSQFKQESNSEVRGAIAESLVSWTEPTPAAMATMRDAVGKEQDENTRYNIARFLGENLDKYPTNKPVLKQLLRTEQSKRIRQSVANALATSKLSGGTH